MNFILNLMISHSISSIFQVLGWYRSTGTAQLKRTELGDSYESAKRVHEEHHRFEQEARVSGNFRKFIVRFLD